MNVRPMAAGSCVIRAALRRRAPLLLLGAALTACTTGSGTGIDPNVDFPQEPLLTTTSEDGSLNIELRAAPDQPPTRGEVAIELLITDAATRAPSEDCELTVVPWMPSMGHGIEDEPTIVSKGQGRYVVTDFALSMAGTWELRTTIAHCADARATPAFQVE